MNRSQLLNLLVLMTLTLLSRAKRNQGINCQGSSQCSKLFNTIKHKNVISGLDYLINNGSISGLDGGPLNTSLQIYAHEDIACLKNAKWAAGSLCMFTQGNVPETGVDGATIGRRIHDLNYHGCKKCGSVPLSGDNNPHAMGILTVNYVTSKACNGICNAIYQNQSSGAMATAAPARHPFSVSL